MAGPGFSLQISWHGPTTTAELQVQIAQLYDWAFPLHRESRPHDQPACTYEIPETAVSQDEAFSRIFV